MNRILRPVTLALLAAQFVQLIAVGGVTSRAYAADTPEDVAKLDYSKPLTDEQYAKLLETGVYEINRIDKAWQTVEDKPFITGPQKAIEWYKAKVPAKIEQFNKYCEKAFLKRIPEKFQKPILFLGNVVPVIPGFAKGHLIPMMPLIPMLRALGNKDKNYFLVVQQPMMGAVNAPIGVAASNILSTGLDLAGKEVLHIVKPETHPPVEMNADIAKGLAVDVYEKTKTKTPDIFSSNTQSQFPRTGVTLNDGLTWRQKYWINIWLSVWIYTNIMVADQISKAQTTQDYLYIAGYAAFQVMWAMFSQHMGTKIITPKLALSFPNDTLMKKIQDPKIRSIDLIKEQIDKMKKADAAIGDSTGSIASVKAEYEKAKSNDKAQAKTLKAKLSEYKDKLEAAKQDKKVATANLEWVVKMRKDLGQGQKLPFTRFLGLLWAKYSWNMRVAIAMISLFVLGQKYVAGKDYNDNALLPVVERTTYNWVQYFKEAHMKALNETAFVVPEAGMNEVAGSDISGGVPDPMDLLKTTDRDIESIAGEMNQAINDTTRIIQPGPVGAQN